MVKSSHQTGEEPTMENVLTPAQVKRIEKLAADAGRTVKQIMPHVLKHGIPELERIIKAVKRGIADADAGRTVSHEDAMERIRATIARHADKKAA
jgi:predicted transcriptional regulator